MVHHWRWLLIGRRGTIGWLLAWWRWRRWAGVPIWCGWVLLSWVHRWWRLLLWLLNWWLLMHRIRGWTMIGITNIAMGIWLNRAWLIHCITRYIRRGTRLLRVHLWLVCRLLRVGIPARNCVYILHLLLILRWWGWLRRNSRHHLLIRRFMHNGVTIWHMMLLIVIIHRWLIWMGCLLWHIWLH